MSQLDSQKDTEPLYRRTAQRLERMIEDGSFRVGDRLPSVRDIHREWGISISTAMEAYRILENAGLIEVRPQSGYYVIPRMTKKLELPECQVGHCKPTRVFDDDLSLKIKEDSDNPEYINLSSAVPADDLLPANKLNRCLSSVLKKKSKNPLVYENTQGYRSLRSEVARRLSRGGCSLTPDDLIITAGCLEAVHFAIRAVTCAGDTIAVESPTYFWFFKMLEGLHRKVVEIPSHPKNGLSVEALRYALDHEKISAVIVMPTFANPTGAVMPDPAKAELLTLLSERNIPVIEDDIYGDLSYQKNRPRTLKSFDETGSVIYCSSLSKSLTTGWRIGWVAPGKFFDEVMTIKAYTNVATNTPCQRAASEFFAQGGYDHHLRKLNRALRERVTHARRLIAAHFPDGTRVSDPEGGYILWVQLPEGIEPLKFYEDAKLQKVVFTPGMLFTRTSEHDRSIRLNCSQPMEQLEQGLKILGKLFSFQ